MHTAEWVDVRCVSIWRHFKSIFFFEIKIASRKINSTIFINEFARPTFDRQNINNACGVRNAWPTRAEFASMFVVRIEWILVSMHDAPEDDWRHSIFRSIFSLCVCVRCGWPTRRRYTCCSKRVLKCDLLLILWFLSATFGSWLFAVHQIDKVVTDDKTGEMIGAGECVCVPMELSRRRSHVLQWN